jgi:hypothetical protein
MNENITVSKTSFVQLLSDLYPNPDDPGDMSSPWGPYGPIGPLVSWFVSRVSWALLNPQPLPPEPPPDLWKFTAPIAVPWRAALLARMVIDRVVAEYQFVEVAAGAGTSEGAHDGVRLRISEFIDDFCGTRPRRWPLPWPWPPKLDPAQIRPLDLLLAGAQFQRASDAMVDNPLQADFSAAADQLLQTGLNRLESEGRESGLRQGEAR